MLHAFSPGDMSAKEEADIKAWAAHRELQTKARAGFLDHKIQKLSEARKFLRHFDAYQNIFAQAAVILDWAGEAAGPHIWSSSAARRRP